MGVDCSVPGKCGAHTLAFTVHDGDLKVGSGVPCSVTPTTCSDAMYVQALGCLNALNAPAMFTPGWIGTLRAIGSVTYGKREGPADPA
jgi:hypothetical protein